ncbi:MAG: TetR/AcrR family transcriptional regulator [Clostridia bacterium]|nr:TetR/AcrR family transcriptional regulator [Clostridia bacterium]
MKNEEIYRELFIENTLRLVAEGGFEKATTRAIAGECREVGDVKVNEAHIYRIYGKKDNLFADVFSILDCELLAAVKEGLQEFDKESDKRKQWELLFTRLWNFLLTDEGKCRYYVRYYYSAYLKGESLRAHQAKFRDFICDMMPYFTENADVCSILQHVVTVMLSFAICVYNGTLLNDDNNVPHVFNVIYSSVHPYLR